MHEKEPPWTKENAPTTDLLISKRGKLPADDISPGALSGDVCVVG